MRALILFSAAAGLIGGILPKGRVSECAQAAMGLIAVRLVCELIAGVVGLAR